MSLGEAGAPQPGRACRQRFGQLPQLPENLNSPGKVTVVPSLPAYRLGSIGGNIAFSDGEHQIHITLDKGKPWLVATDKNGKQTFKGPIATEAEMKAVPDAIRRKLEMLHAKVMSAGGFGGGGIGGGGFGYSLQMGEDNSPQKSKPEPKAEESK